MNQMMTREARAKALQQALLVDFCYVTVKPKMDSDGFKIEIDQGNVDFISNKAKDMLGEGTFEVKELHPAPKLKNPKPAVTG